MLINYICPRCGSDDVVADTWSHWNVKEQEWETSFVPDKGMHSCETCGEEFTRFEEVLV